MSEHTKEPWVFSLETEDYYMAIKSKENGQIIVSFVHEYGKLPGHTVGDFRRIVACVNACVGIPTDLLEQLTTGELSELFFDHWDAD